ncbi:hypothetical protein [uncultured Prevotella sp.]|uniref:hypothetical protein n=1 Tax=uncultured Prevotella sp. TaxID=159272 RepID=UPI0027E2383E|nr:hypothetical protein [uncultured Prevotella sp.]
MIVKRFQNRVAESRIALPVTGVYAFAVCALGGLFTEQLWVQFVLLAVSSFLMMELNNVNALIRIYSRMVSCSFLVLAVMSQYLVVDVRCGIVQACFIAFYLFLFSAYQDNRAMGRVFYAFLMLGIASTMFVQILFFVPLVWVLLCTNLMVRSFRAFVSSLFGLLVPYWFMVAYYLYIDDVDSLLDHFLQIAQFGPVLGWMDMPVSHILTAAYVAILAVVGMIHFRLNNYKDKIRTRMLFEIFSVLALAAIVFMILQPQHIDYLLALLIVSTSPMIGHYIALTNTFITNISFYVMLVVALIITCVNLWMPF